MLVTRRAAGRGPLWGHSLWVALAAGVVAGVSLGGACGDDAQPGAAASAASPHEVRVEMLGVDPADFECASIADEERVAAIVGGRVEISRSVFAPPRGVTRPCIYTLARYAANDAGPEAIFWSLDLDCRKSAREDGERLLTQYATRPGAEPIRVGASGIDIEPALVFLDDDAPCYVRVVGPDRERRIALARLVADELTALNAPMTPLYRRTRAAGE
jgi:hypothetical protein